MQPGTEERRALARDLEGLFAYDTGAVGSGTHDEGLRERRIADLKRHAASPANREFFSTLLRDMWLSDEAIAAGYGVEDMLAFVDWLQDRMGIYLR